jgi:hypothetical protein
MSEGLKELTSTEQIHTSSLVQKPHICIFFLHIVQTITREEEIDYSNVVAVENLSLTHQTQIRNLQKAKDRYSYCMVILDIFI